MKQTRNQGTLTDVLKDVVAERILDQWERTRNDGGNELSLLYAR